MTQREFVERAATHSVMLPPLLGQTVIEIKPDKILIKAENENIRAVLSTPHLKEALRHAASGKTVEVFI